MTGNQPQEEEVGSWIQEVEADSWTLVEAVGSWMEVKEADNLIPVEAGSWMSGDRNMMRMAADIF